MSSVSHPAQISIPWHLTIPKMGYVYEAYLTRNTLLAQFANRRLICSYIWYSSYSYSYEHKLCYIHMKIGKAHLDWCIVNCTSALSDIGCFSELYVVKCLCLCIGGWGLGGLGGFVFILLIPLFFCLFFLPTTPSLLVVCSGVNSMQPSCLLWLGRDLWTPDTQLRPPPLRHQHPERDVRPHRRPTPPSNQLMYIQHTTNSHYVHVLFIVLLVTGLLFSKNTPTPRLFFCCVYDFTIYRLLIALITIHSWLDLK